jgi:integrase
MEDFQLREDHWIVADLVGKAKHVRTIPVPRWVKKSVDEWTRAAEIHTGFVFRKVNSLNKVWGERLSSKAIWHIVKKAAKRAGIDRLAPHDLRRSCAKFCHMAGGELEQIQFLLGHVSIQTTEQYLGCKQKLRNAVNDNLGFEDL